MNDGRAMLRFRHLNIRRTPGISSPFTISDLSDGINIAYGPNASGKSTTAQALQTLLWNDLKEWPRASLAGQLEIDGTAWQVDIDAGTVDVQRDGQKGARLPVDAVNYRDRYILTLHDLLRAEDADFANVILRESSGGYDLDAAQNALGYRDTPPRPRNNINALRSAALTTREALRGQQELLREQQELERSKERLNEARAATAEVTVLTRALDAHRRSRELALAHETLNALPKGIARLNGEELTRLDELAGQAAEYDQRRRQIEADIQVARAEVDASGLADVTLPAGFIAGLRAKGQQLQGLAARVREAERDVSLQSQQREHAARQLSGLIDESQIRGLEAGNLRQLVKLAREHEQARAERDAAEELRDWLGDFQTHEDADQIRQGTTLLNAWLRSDGASNTSAFRWMLPAGIASVLILSIVLAAAYIGHPYFLLASILIFMPPLIAFAIRPKPASTRSAFTRNEYARLGLDQPQAWQAVHVETLVDELNRQLRHMQLEQAKALRWSNLETRWQQAISTFAEIDGKWRQELAKMGLEPASPSDLYLIAQNLDRWQAADSQLLPSQTGAVQERDRLSELLMDLNRDLAMAGYPDSTDQAVILGHIDDLDERRQMLDSARQKLASNRNALEQIILPEIVRVDDERRGIFGALGLPDGDRQTLSEWLDLRDDYRAATDAVKESEIALRQARSELGEHTALLERDELELSADLESAQLRAGEVEQLQRSIIEVETRIANAKQERNLEQALANEEMARNVLRNDREEGYRLASGWMLAEFIRQQTRDRDRPQVFHRARELFVRMTQGRYVLQFSESPAPSFRAVDTTTNMNHGLDELSSATRVQLLMAVRMAFVEEMEHGPKLPLILDETLGNADEHRAEAIIRAVCEICRAGRQVFYFTAQLDEVGKWRRLLREYDGLAYKVISLVETRQLPEYERSMLEDLEPAGLAVPHPSGMTHQMYRSQLQVPTIDLDLGADAVHLWYLIHEPEALHRLLILGVSTWGQFRTLVAYGGDELTSPEVFSAALARARIVDAALQAQRIGHGKSVDRAAVLDSNAFTPAFLDRVVRQAEQVEGDAKKLLQRLEDGRVSRMRGDYIDAFRTYLSEEGYLDNEDPLSMGQVRARVLGEAAKDIAAGVIQVEDVDMLIRSVSTADVIASIPQPS